MKKQYNYPKQNSESKSKNKKKEAVLEQKVNLKTKINKLIEKNQKKMQM